MTDHGKGGWTRRIMVLLSTVCLFGWSGCDKQSNDPTLDRPFEPAAEQETPVAESSGVSPEAQEEEASSSNQKDQERRGLNLQGLAPPKLKIADQRLLGVHLPEGFSHQKSSQNSGTAMIQASAKQIETFYRTLNYTMVTRTVPGNRIGYQLAVSDEAMDAIPEENKSALATARIYLFPVGEDSWSVQVYPNNSSRATGAGPDPMGYIYEPAEFRGRRATPPRRESNSAGSVGGRKRPKINVDLRPKLRRWKKDHPNRPLLD